MKSRNTGTIINIGSIAGRVPYAGGSIYCASKAAVQAFTEAMRHELISTRIRIVNIDPGQVETEFSIVRFRGDQQAAKKVYEGVTPLTGQDIAEVIVFAASRNENVVIADVPLYSPETSLIVGAGVSESSIWADANASKSDEIASPLQNVRWIDRGNMLLESYSVYVECFSVLVFFGVYSRTTNVAIPWPVLAHILVTPNFPPVSPKCARIVAISRPPVAPSGSTHPSDHKSQENIRPIAIAPPLGFTFSGSNPTF